MIVSDTVNPFTTTRDSRPGERCKFWPWPVGGKLDCWGPAKLKVPLSHTLQTNPCVPLCAILVSKRRTECGGR